MKPKIRRGMVSVLRAGVTPQQYPLHVGSDAGRPLFALFVGQAGNRMRGDYELIVGYAHHPGHGLGGVQKYVGDYGSGGYAQPLHLDAVVHTARAARPSITHPGDQDVHLVQRLLHHFGLGRQGCAVLAQHDHIFKAVLAL